MRTSTALLCVVHALLCCVNVRADDPWPKFRGPHGNGVAAATSDDVPTRWSADQNIAWRTDLPGKGWSSPVVGDGHIYLTAAIPQSEGEANRPHSYSLAMLRIDVETGELEKNVTVFEQTPERPAKIHAKNSHASPTAILSGDRVYVHFGYQGTACLTRDGQIVWVNRDFYFQPTHGNGGTPVLVEDRLIFTCDGDKRPKVVALDADTGQQVWEVPRPVDAKKTFSFCTPTVIQVGGQKQVIAPGSDCVLSIDPATGKTLWDVRYSGYSVVPKPIHHQKLVLVSTSFDKASLLAIRPDGYGNVTETHVEWRTDRSIPKTPSMLAADGLVYTVSDDGIVQCFEVESGVNVYRKRLGGNFSSSPILVGNRIYFTSEDGTTTVIRAGRSFEEISKNELNERTLASLAVAGDSLLQRTETSLIRIRSER